MRLKILASSSTGNAYILENDTEALLIECGVRFSIIKKALDFNITKVAGCICTHQHRDHSKSIKEVMSSGITVLALADVFNSHDIPLDYFRAKVIEPEKGYKIGNFKIFGFPVCHDVPCLSFYINHPDMGSMVFITDTFMVEYQLPPVDYLIIEANYEDSILEENIISGKVHPSMRPRLLASHMALSTLKEILLTSDLSNVKTICLCHLSAQNSNERLFIDEMTKATGKQVYAAKKGLELTFDKTPY